MPPTPPHAHRFLLGKPTRLNKPAQKLVSEIQYRVNGYFFQETGIAIRSHVLHGCCKSSVATATLANTVRVSAFSLFSEEKSAKRGKGPLIGVEHANGSCNQAARIMSKLLRALLRIVRLITHKCDEPVAAVRKERRRGNRPAILSLGV